MTTMVTEIYEAFKSAGVDDAQAKAAAEALYKDSQLATKLDLARMKSELLTWVAGMMIVQTVTILGAAVAIVRLGVA